MHLGEPLFGSRQLKVVEMGGAVEDQTWSKSRAKKKTQFFPPLETDGRVDGNHKRLPLAL